MALDPAIVERALREATKRAENLEYFFDRLGTPEWIDPLREQGYFFEAPEQYVDDQGLVMAPGWCESRYLARMAVSAPDIVLQVIESIETNNDRVLMDFVDAALAMPVEQASRVARIVAAWISGREHIYYVSPSKLVDLICMLIEHGAFDAAEPLLNALFAPSREERQNWRPGLRARFNEWAFDQGLQAIIGRSLPFDAPRALAKIGQLLDDALKLLGERGDGDLSRIWRVHIGDDSQRAERVEEALVSAVRDAADQIRTGGLLEDAELVGLLTEHSGELFRRIAMHALARDPEPRLDVVLPFVLDVEELTSAEPSPEFRELLSATAPRLSPDQIAGLREAILGGPDVERYTDLARKHRHHEPTDEETAGYVAWWRIGRLVLIRDALPEEERAAYEALVAEHGEAEIPLSWEIRTFSGPNSPLSPEVLAEKSDDELLAYLRDWQPEAWPGSEPSVDGLARAMSAVAEIDPARIARIAEGLREVRPAYVHWIVHGLEEAVRNGAHLDWPALLNLLVWVVEQPRERPGGRGDEDSDVDPGWVWTRREIASLLDRGLNDPGAGGIPTDERDRVWTMIAVLSEDADPTPEHEQEYGGQNMDPSALALNTVRPYGLRAAVAYALWVRRQLSDDQKQSAEGFVAAHIPEVSALLGAHLDPRHDPSAAVRAVYGQHFTTLLAMDRGWARSNASAIFPTDDSPLREAGWASYVIYSKPYNDVLDTLREVHQRSAELADHPGHGFRWMNGEPVEKLGEHIAMYLWRGVLPLDDDLVETFWSNAPATARAHTVEFLGRAASEAQLTPAVRERLIAFWAWVRQNVRPGDERVELRGFAWWFGAGDLPIDWQLNQVGALLDDGIEPEPAFRVAERLPALAEERPAECLRVLRLLIVHGDQWAVDAWREHIEELLRKTLGSEDEEARQAARDTVDWLLARGYRGFRALVPSPTPEEGSAHPTARRATP